MDTSRLHPRVHAHAYAYAPDTIDLADIQLSCDLRIYGNKGFSTLTTEMFPV